MNIEFVIDDTGSKDREDGAEIQVLAKEENIRFVFVKAAAEKNFFLIIGITYKSHKW